MTKESKTALRDRQIKVDRHVSNLGQAGAKRYLDTHKAPNSGNIREWIAGALFAILVVALAVIILAL